MNQSEDSAYLAATWNRLTQRIDEQSWPTSALYVVATPIGNLADLSLRAWSTLRRCDVIAAEDTRASRTLLDAWGVATPLMAAHKHNEAAAAQSIVERLTAGERVALISDAGAPAVSDPGARIVRAVREAGYTVVPVPGPSAVITALMASGATSDENPAFLFAGFPPSKSGARQKWLRLWCTVPAPIVFFESPHRVEVMVADLLAQCGPERLITFARELTKRFEEIATMPLQEAQSWLSHSSHRQTGEFVLIVHEAPEPPQSLVDEAVLELLDTLLGTVSVRDAARLVSRATGISRDVLYAAALNRQRSTG